MRAQFGLTTLIIFIALIVTAAVAAGVIIYTTQTMQQQSLQTGAEAKQRVSTGIEVVRVLGYQYDSATNSLNTGLQRVTVVAPIVRLMSGSNPINFNDISVSILTKDTALVIKNSNLPSSIIGEYVGTRILLNGFIRDDNTIGQNYEFRNRTAIVPMVIGIGNGSIPDTILGSYNESLRSVYLDFYCNNSLLSRFELRYPRIYMYWYESSSNSTSLMIKDEISGETTNVSTCETISSYYSNITIIYETMSINYTLPSESKIFISGKESNYIILLARNNTTIEAVIKPEYIESPISILDLFKIMQDLITNLYNEGVQSNIAYIGIDVKTRNAFLEKGETYNLVMYSPDVELNPEDRYNIIINVKNGYPTTINGKVPSVLEYAIEDIWAK